MNHNSDTGFALLADYVESCAFIHDDWNPLLGYSDWDQYDTNPFLLGAHTCVVNTLDGFGCKYLDYLSTLSCLPEKLFAPEPGDPILLQKLLANQELRSRFIETIIQRRLHISSFYSDGIRGFESLGALIGNDSHFPSIYPSQNSFTTANDKAEARIRLQRNGLPIPDGASCYSKEEVESYLRNVCRNANSDRVIAKESHRKNRVLPDCSDMCGKPVALSVPVVLEKIYGVKSSPICHVIKWDGKTEILFIVDQIIDNFHHVGNAYPASGMLPAIEQAISCYTKRIIDLFPDFMGVMGVDFIITRNDEIFVVDVNPRFCSSTYPYYFLQRNNMLRDEFCARSFVIRRPVVSLSDVMERVDGRLFSATMGGVLFYNPVYDFVSQQVSHFSCLIVDSSTNELNMLHELVDRATKVA